MFKITIDELVPRENKDSYGSKYDENEIYKQQVEIIDLWAIIDAVNIKKEPQLIPKGSNCFVG